VTVSNSWNTGRKRRAIVNFNEVQPQVDAVAGFMAQNRRQAKAIARMNTDQGQQIYSKRMNSLLDYHRERTNADQLETEQDLDMLVNGYGAVDTELSYDIGHATTMPNGEIAKKRIDPSSVYWYPAAKQKNLLDARWCGYWEDYELSDALSLFQGSDQSDFRASAALKTRKKAVMYLTRMAGFTARLSWITR